MQTNGNLHLNGVAIGTCNLSFSLKLKRAGKSLFSGGLERDITTSKQLLDLLISYELHTKHRLYFLAESFDWGSSSLGIFYHLLGAFFCG